MSEKDKTIELPVCVMYYDSDAAGVMHNVAYLRHVETARTLLARDLGMSFQTIVETGIHPLVLRTEIDYISPALLGDEIIVHGRVGEVGRARFWVEFELVRGETLLARCRQSLALVKMPEGRPVRIAKGFPALAQS